MDGVYCTQPWVSSYSTKNNRVCIQGIAGQRSAETFVCQVEGGCGRTDPHRLSRDLGWQTKTTSAVGSKGVEMRWEALRLSSVNEEGGLSN